MSLIPIKYHRKIYPSIIKSNIEEIAGHFDKENIRPKMDYSLHTEYSVGKRNLVSKLLSDLHYIKNANKNSVPQLWYNKKWSGDFYNFITRIVGNNKPPDIIEIHPPFSDYCNLVYDFIQNYAIFELKIRETFPDTKIFIENRCGTIYSGGKFIFSKINELNQLSDVLDKNNLKLKIVLDIPQLLAAHNINLRNISIANIESVLESIKTIAHNISGIHLWGKKLTENDRWISHIGDLNDYFSGNKEQKNFFLRKVYDVFNDGKKRYFVPEVNSSSEDLQSIVNDMINVGFKFV